MKMLYRAFVIMGIVLTFLNCKAAIASNETHNSYLLTQVHEQTLALTATQPESPTASEDVATPNEGQAPSENEQQPREIPTWMFLIAVALIGAATFAQLRQKKRNR